MTIEKWKIDQINRQMNMIVCLEESVYSEELEETIKYVSNFKFTESAEKDWKKVFQMGRDWKKKEGTKEKQKNILEHLLDMVKIKVKVFTMGSPRDEEDREYNEVQHELTLSRDYFVDEISSDTSSLWESVMGDNPSDFKGAIRPVENVSWLDSVLFANKLK